MATGKIIEFRRDRGFGFIQPAGGRKLFFHINDARQLGSEPQVGDQVSFEEGASDKGPKAINVRPLGAAVMASAPTRPARNPHEDAQGPTVRNAAQPYRFLNPYNFVRYGQPARSFAKDADAILLGRSSPPPHDRYVGMSGTIACELETVSPLFIADAEDITPNFKTDGHNAYRFFTYDFGNGPEPAIPASSLRGMLRSIFEAATNSCYAHFDYDRRLSYHLAAEEALKLVPARVDQDSQGRLRLHLLPGTARLSIGKRPEKLYAGRVERYEALVSGRSKFAKTKSEVIFKPVDIGKLQHGDNCYALAEPLKFPPVWHIHRLSTDVKALMKLRRPATETQGPLEVLEGFLCLNHQNIEAKRFERFFFRTFGQKNEAEFVLLSQKVQEDYNLLVVDYRERHAQTVEKWQKAGFDPAQVRIEKQDGKLKKEAAFSRLILASKEDARLKVGDLVYAMLSGTPTAPNVEFIVPVAVPRVMYERKIAELLPQHLWKCQEYDQLCPACRTFGWVFGDEESSSQQVADQLTTRVAYQGRVRLEHGQLLEPAQTLPTTSLAILSSPKPTTTRFYLAPSNGKPKDRQGDFAAGYDNQENQLRGRKVYRHHGHDGDLSYWQDATREFQRVGKNSDQNRTVEGALAPGAKFTFNIRFTNLAPIELGALLWSLELEGAQVHRLGYAKPLGFGSVRVRVKQLDVLDTNNRYAALTPAVTSSELDTAKREELRQQFKRAMERAYGRDFAELPQIHDLLTLLSAPEADLPIHYPRPEIAVDPEGKNYEWFMGNNRNKDARFALELTGQERGFPRIDKNGRIKQ